MEPNVTAASARQGKRLVGAVVAALVISTILFAAGSMIVAHTAPTLLDVLRFLVLLVLCYFLLGGKLWARWSVVVLLGVVGVLGAAGTTLAMPYPGAYASLTLSVIYLACAVVLARNRHVSEHFAGGNQHVG